MLNNAVVALKMMVLVVMNSIALVFSLETFDVPWLFVAEVPTEKKMSF